MSEAEQRAAIVAEAMTWLCTPYHHNARVRGAGVDCAQLPAAVYEAAGIIDHVAPDYPHDWHMHRNAELYVEWIQRLGGIEIPIDEMAPADFMVWRFGRTFSHGAIYIGGGQVIHAWQQAGMVCLDNWEDLEELARRERRAFTFWKRVN